MRLTAVAMLALFGGASCAATVQAKDEAMTLESVRLMRTAGSLRLGDDGKVVDLHIAAPQALREPLRRIVSGWRLLPVVHPQCTPGRPLSAAFKVVLAEGPAGAPPTIDNVYFHGLKIDALAPPRRPGFTLQPVEYAPPTYPRKALRNDARAKVAVVMRIGIDGRVVNAAVLQSALVDVDPSMENAGKLLAKFEASALEAARGWDFAIRTDSDEPLREPFDVIQPVSFLFTDADVVLDNKWGNYLRGPRRAPPWGDPVLWKRVPGVADLGSSQLRQFANCVVLEHDPAGTPVR